MFNASLIVNIAYSIQSFRKISTVKSAELNLSKQIIYCVLNNTLTKSSTTLGSQLVELAIFYALIYNSHSQMSLLPRFARKVIRPFVNTPLSREYVSSTTGSSKSLTMDDVNELFAEARLSLQE